MKRPIIRWVDFEVTDIKNKNYLEFIFDANLMIKIIQDWQNSIIRELDVRLFNVEE